VAKRSTFGNVHWYRGLKARFDVEKRRRSLRPTTSLGAFSAGDRAQQRESSAIARRAQQSLGCNVVEDVHDVVVSRSPRRSSARDIFATAYLSSLAASLTLAVFTTYVQSAFHGACAIVAKSSSVPLASVASRRCRYRYRAALEQYRAGAKNETRHRGLVNDVTGGLKNSIATLRTCRELR